MPVLETGASEQEFLECDFFIFSHRKPLQLETHWPIAEGENFANFSDLQQDTRISEAHHNLCAYRIIGIRPTKYELQ